MPNDYELIYKTAEITPSKWQAVYAVLHSIVSKRDRYSFVEQVSSVPWFCVACIHELEASLNFSTHLHNGDPLTNRTVRFPAGRPVESPISGNFPYSWTESALDALDDRWRPKLWDLSGCLEFLERYNGLGYRARGVNSPYLWGSTNQYEKGKFGADGVFDPDMVSVQIGAAAVLKGLEQSRCIKF